MEEFLSVSMAMFLLCVAIWIARNIHRHKHLLEYLKQYFDVTDEIVKAAIAHRRRKKRVYLNYYVTEWQYDNTKIFAELMYEKRDASHMFCFKQLWWLGIAKPSPFIDFLNDKHIAFFRARKKWRRTKALPGLSRFPLHTLYLTPMFAELYGKKMPKATSRKFSREALADIVAHRASARSD